MFSHFATSTPVRMRIRLFDSVFTPVAGILQAAVTATILRPDGTTQALTAAAGTNGFNWAEVTTGAFSGKGFYQMLMTSDLFTTPGEYTVAVTGGTGGAVAQFSVWAAFPSDIQTRLGTPAAATVSADIAAAAADAELARKMVTNKAEQVSNQYKVYDDDGTTVLKTFDTKDSTGAATNTQVYKRIPA
jgi:hypothetical protein